MIWTGWAICVLSLVAASFAKSAWQLILTQGLAYGIGFLILYYPILSMLNEWFVVRRGLAYGILFAAAGISGAGLPFLTDSLLKKLGYATTLRIFAGIMVIIIGPMLPLCRGRLPPAVGRTTSVVIEWRPILKNPIFYFFTISNLFQGLAFYLPFFYVVLYAESLSVSSTKAVVLFAILNVSQVVGQVAIGWLSDSFNTFLLLLGSNAGSIVACILWATATGFNALVFFSIIYGLFAGGYSVLVTRFVSTLTDDGPTELWLYGVLAFERGAGNVASGPLSALLLKTMYNNASQSTGDPSVGYRQLVYFVGACLITASIGGLGVFARQRTPTPATENIELRAQRRKASQSSLNGG
jgi:MFS family permease